MTTGTDFGGNVIPAMLDGGARVFGYRFDGYWQDVGTVESYWQAHMDLLEEHPALDLYDKDWLIHTRSEERAPARIGPTANVHRIADQPRLPDRGHGRAIRAVARRARRPGRGRARLDHHVRHGHPRRRGRRPGDHRQGSVRSGPTPIVGMGSDYDTPNRQEPGRLNTGITVVGKRAVIPAGVRIGRNVRIAETCAQGRLRQQEADPERRHGRGQGRWPARPRGSAKAGGRRAAYRRAIGRLCVSAGRPPLTTYGAVLAQKANAVTLYAELLRLPTKTAQTLGR